LAKAKDIRIKPISRQDADRIVKAVHYSGKVVRNSQIHLGIFLKGRCGGAMQFGPSLDKRRVIGLVRGTKWNEFIELNRMAFADWLPRNSESRAIGYSMRWLRKQYPHLKWVISFADGTQCGDGTIYRASGFHLTGYSSGSLWVLPESLAKIYGSKTAHKMAIQDKSSRLSEYILTQTKGKNCTMENYVKRFGGHIADGFMFRYIYFLDQTCLENITVPILPFSTIGEINGGMYRGKPIERASSIESDAPGDQPGEGGANPTGALHYS